jgi:hypothetical protein
MHALLRFFVLAICSVVDKRRKISMKKRSTVDQNNNDMMPSPKSGGVGSKKKTYKKLHKNT